MPNRDIYSTDNWLGFLRKTDTAILKTARMDVFKGSGRGGQKRNKTSNAIRLTLSHLTVTESAARSRAANINGAIRKIRMAIALDVLQATKNRNKFKKLPEEIRIHLQTDLMRINPKNPIFPIFIGSLIDVYIKHKGEIGAIAQEFQTNTSQIRKFIDRNSFLLESLKELRRQFMTSFPPGLRNRDL